jgi:hypothetical protein
VNSGKWGPNGTQRRYCLEKAISIILTDMRDAIQQKAVLSVIIVPHKLSQFRYILKPSLFGQIRAASSVTK